jgi:Skp family chaperone for outer membrane proteins
MSGFITRENEENVMNKKILSALLVLAFCCTTTVACAQQKGDDMMYKEAYINIDSVWRASDKGKEQLAKIEEQVKASKEELQNLNEELKALREQFDKASEQTQKQEIAKQMELKRREVIELSGIKRQEIEMMRNEAQQNFVEEVLPLINKYREEQGYVVVHRYSPNNIVSVDPKVDITEEVLEMYNKGEVK